MGSVQTCQTCFGCGMQCVAISMLLKTEKIISTSDKGFGWVRCGACQGNGRRAVTEQHNHQTMEQRS